MRYLIAFLFTLLVSMTTVFAQDRTVMNRHKFDAERPARVKHRDLTADVDSTGFVMNAWGGECYMKVNALQQMAVNADFYEVGERNGHPYMLYGNDNVRFRMYINKKGNFEFDAIIFKRPVNGDYVIPFWVETQGLDFLFQDTLMDIEKAPPINATQPDWAKFSYAVYHSTMKNDYIKADGTTESYTTGKAFHIPRPKVWDANGDTTWGTVRIFPELNRMYIGVDPVWGANATLPITFDPEFGYSTNGALERDMPGPNNVWVQVNDTYVASTGDVVTELHCWGRTFSSTQTALFGLYEIDAGVPNALHLDVQAITFDIIAEDESVTGLSSALTNGVEYGIACGTGSGTVRVKYDGSCAGCRSTDNSQPFPLTGFDDPFAESGTSSQRFSWYAVYTESAAGATPTRRRRLGEYSEKATMYCAVPVLRD